METIILINNLIILYKESSQILEITHQGFNLIINLMNLTKFSLKILLFNNNLDSMLLPREISMIRILIKIKLKMKFNLLIQREKQNIKENRF